MANIRAFLWNFSLLTNLGNSVVSYRLIQLHTVVVNRVNTRYKVKHRVIIMVHNTPNSTVYKL